jgi:hypothetical protein
MENKINNLVIIIILNIPSARKLLLNQIRTLINALEPPTNRIMPIFRAGINREFYRVKVTSAIQKHISKNPPFQQCQLFTQSFNDDGVFERK